MTYLLRDFSKLTARRVMTPSMAIACVGIVSLLAQAQPVWAAERSLAGIRIFSKASILLKRFGEPSEVVPANQTPGATPGQTAGGGAAPSTPGGAPGLGGLAGVLGQLPGLLGEGTPQQNNPQPQPQAQTPTTPVRQEYTWIYDRPDGTSLEFTLSQDGRVVQIRATGYKGNSKTSKGIALGANYGSVIERYGYPETQDFEGAILTAYYTERDHVAFQFYNQKLVGIIVAAVE